MSVPVYKVNPQTGDVVKDDGTGWKPVVSARNKQSGQIVVDEGAGWGQLVRSQDGSWSLSNQAPSNPQAPEAATRARGAMDAGLPIDKGDLNTLTRPNFQPLTPAQQAFAETPQARFQQQQFEDQRQREGEDARLPEDVLGERILMAGNGPTFGNAPRLAAGVSTLTALASTPFNDGDIIDRKGISGANQQFLEDNRVHQRRAREKRPNESLALEIVPAFLQGRTLLEGVGKKLLPKATALQSTTRVVGTGAAGGATYMASQNESGTAEGALEDAKTGALYGAGGGLAFKGAEMPARVAFRAAKTGAANISDALSAALGRVGTARDNVAEQVAVAAVNRSADRAGLTMDQMMGLVKKYEGKPAVLAEVIGQDAINALTALTRTLGKTSQKAQDIIEERSYGWYDRAKGDIEDATGFAPGQVDQIVEEGMEAGREKARPFYEQLYSQFKDVKSFPESLKRVNRLLRSPGMERHIELAEKAVRNASAKRGIPLSKMSKMEYFDLIKQSLDDAIDSAVSKGENRTRIGESVRDLTELKSEFVKELDRLTGGTYSAAREAGGEAPRLRQAAVEGQKAFGAKNPRVVEQTVQGTTEEALPALRAGMADDLATRVDKGSLIPGRFRRPDIANKTRAVFGEDAGNQLIGKMDAEATLRETGSRWAPRMNSVTGTVMESGPSQMGDDLVNAGMNILTGNKLGLFRQAINFARQRGFSQRQLDSIGDLLLSDPKEGLLRLGRMRPDGTPSVGGQAASAQNALSSTDGGGAITNPNNALAIGAGKAKPKPAPQSNAGPKPGSGKLTPEEIAMLLGKDEPPVSGAGWTGKRPVGFNDELPRGTERFSDPRLKPDQNKRVEMGRNGFSNAEVGEEFGMSANAVSVEFTNIRRDFGIEIPFGRMGPEAVVGTKILSLAEKGLKPKVIAERLGITPVQARVTLSRARKAVKDAGRELPEWLKPQTAGIDAGSELSQFGVGTGLGAQGAQDLDGDGKISFAERAAGAAAGYGVIKGGVRLSRNGGRGVSGAGSKGRPNLPMDQASRMARAKADGFDTDTVLYHGTPDRRPIDSEGFKTATERNQKFLMPDARSGEKGPYWFTENRKKAQSYADDSRSFDSQNAQPAVLQVFLRKPSNPLIIDAGGTVFSDIPRDRVLAALSPEALAKIPQNWRRQGGDSFRSDDIVKIARDAGFDGIQIRNVVDDYSGVGRPGNTYATFDPKNIRSVDAAFDPDESASPILSAGFAGKPPKPPKKRLGRGLDSLMDDTAPVRKPAQTSPVGNALEAKPRTGADWTEAERKAFINSGHEEGLIPIEPASSFVTIKDARKSMKKIGVDINAGSTNDYEGGFPVLASILGAGGATAGVLGLLSAYLNQKPKSSVPPELAKERASLADKAATAYQNDPNGDEFRNTMIRIQQLDRKIEGGEASGEPSAPSYKPRRIPQGNALALPPRNEQGQFMKEAR